VAEETVGVITVPCAAGSTVARFVALVYGLADDLKRELVLIGGRTVRWTSPPAPITSDDLRRVATRFLNQFA
jgi:hypothetical protein